MSDPRNIANGHEIPSEGYCDQPYAVVNEDGSWTCVLTTGRGVEGQPGQHIVSIISRDQGQTWSDPVDIEPADGPEASWAQPLKTPDGRIYVFYVYNRENLRAVIADDPPYERGVCRRVDSLGVYACKYSDDNGRTWSKRRYEIPVRAFAIDRDNPYGGDLRFFWGVGKPFLHDGAACVFASKVGGFGKGFFTRTEGMLLRCHNLVAERDPGKHRWETLPTGDVGLRAPAGPIAEEHNGTVLGDGSLYCTYRTTQGCSGHATSRDGGRTWTPPAWMTYAPGGRRVKNPRAANFVRRFSNGRYVYWYENHGGRDYEGRNPAWLCGGVERGGSIHWSQPEIVLYDADTTARMSYPDFIEQNGRYFVTETQKTVARVHEIDAELLEGMWRQEEHREVAREGLVLDLHGEACRSAREVAMPRLPCLLGGGFSVDLWVRFDDLTRSRIILDTRDTTGQGLLLSLTDRATVQIILNGGCHRNSHSASACGQAACAWDCDPGLLRRHYWHHVAVIVDGGPKIIAFVVDGLLCDGGEARQFGWARFHPALADVNGASRARIAPSLDGELGRLRFYDRYLRTSEAVGNWRAGR